MIIPGFPGLFKTESTPGTSVPDQEVFSSTGQWSPLTPFDAIYPAEWGPQIVDESPVQPMNALAAAPASVHIGLDDFINDEAFAKRLVTVLLKTLGKEAMKELLDEKVYVSRRIAGRRIVHE